MKGLNLLYLWCGVFQALLNIYLFLRIDFPFSEYLHLIQSCLMHCTHLTVLLIALIDLFSASPNFYCSFSSLRSFPFSNNSDLMFKFDFACQTVSFALAFSDRMFLN